MTVNLMGNRLAFDSTESEGELIIYSACLKYSYMQFVRAIFGNALVLRLKFLASSRAFRVA
jgi:hypothetical protein